jgi:tRNA(adenine34) deaminase
MKEALKEAKLALAHGSWPIGCVIVLNNRIIGRAYNQVFPRNDRMAHAEILALQKAQKTLFNLKSRATLYVTYEPCAMCLGAMVIFRVKRVVSGINIDKSGAMHLGKPVSKLYLIGDHDIKHSSGLLAKESYDIFMQSPHAQKLVEKGIIPSVQSTL